jgi:hypothetical protein
MNINDNSESLKLREFIDMSTPKNMAARPPKISYYYFPTSTEEVEISETNGKHIMRRIFEGKVEYLKYEGDSINGLLLFLQDKNYNLDRETFPNSHILRFLQSHNYNYAKTFENLKTNLDWRKVNLPISINDNIIQILNSGFIYIHGRDNRFRPIYVISPKYYNSKPYSVNDWRNSVVFLMEYCINFMLIPGQIENWNIVCDLDKVSLWSIPADLKSIMETIQQNYKCRLHKMYLMNLGSFAKLVWPIAKKIMGDLFDKKLVGVSKPEILFANINKSQIEIKYSGNAKNLIPELSQYFPPVRLPEEYLVEEDYKNDKLFVTENEYLEIISKYPNIVKSPYLILEKKITIEEPVFQTARSKFELNDNNTVLSISVQVENKDLNNISLSSNTSIYDNPCHSVVSNHIMNNGFIRGSSLKESLYDKQYTLRSKHTHRGEQEIKIEDSKEQKCGYKCISNKYSCLLI